MLEEEETNDETLLTAVHDLYEHRDTYIQAMRNSAMQDSIDTIVRLIEETRR